MPERSPLPQRRRRAFLVAVPVVVVLGGALRFGLSGWLADAAGGLAYTALIYVLAGVLRPSWHPAPLAAVAIGFSCAVELAQLTGGPQALVDWWSPMRLAVGQSFSAPD
ncbi:MAG: DUF2809 domain-containing protein, partial [Solirubrobacteraceae bacterium]|nr:DUF2809 domain-containing protein [Solirubrobacteraceae bacterium]